MSNRQFVNLFLLAAAILLAATASQAQIVFSNNFETDTTGFTSSGSLPALTRVSLPTDNGGINSANQSMWLGRLGSGVAKSGSIDEIVTLNVTGLSPGTVYSVAFDLLVGASWDGSAVGFGPDSWRFAANGLFLVNTTFTNGNAGEEYGAVSPQKYSDTTYANLLGPTFGKFTGADKFFTTGGSSNYGLHYGIYYFGHGAGNPVLTFAAASSTATLEFARYGDTTDSGDEYWALDNVQVSVVPEPTSLALALFAGLGFVGVARRSRSR